MTERNTMWCNWLGIWEEKKNVFLSFFLFLFVYFFFFCWDKFSGQSVVMRSRCNCYWWPTFAGLSWKKKTKGHLYFFPRFLCGRMLTCWPRYPSPPSRKEDDCTFHCPPAGLCPCVQFQSDIFIFFFLSLLFLFPRDLFAGSSFPSPLCVCVCDRYSSIDNLCFTDSGGARARLLFVYHARPNARRPSFPEFSFFFLLSSSGLILFNLFVFINSDFYDFFFSFYK